MSCVAQSSRLRVRAASRRPPCPRQSHAEALGGAATIKRRRGGGACDSAKVPPSFRWAELRRDMATVGGGRPWVRGIAKAAVFEL